MSEPVAPVGYFLGDEIKMRLSFTHDDQIVAVDAVYVHEEHSAYVLTLSGNPELDGSFATAGEGKRSTVVLTGVMDVAQYPGRYRFAHLVFYTFAGGGFYDYPGRDDRERWPVLELRYSADKVEITDVELDPNE